MTTLEIDATAWTPLRSQLKCTILVIVFFFSSSISFLCFAYKNGNGKLCVNLRRMNVFTAEIINLF